MAERWALTIGNGGTANSLLKYSRKEFKMGKTSIVFCASLIAALFLGVSASSASAKVSGIVFDEHQRVTLLLREEPAQTRERAIPKTETSGRKVTRERSTRKAAVESGSHPGIAFGNHSKNN